MHAFRSGRCLLSLVFSALSFLLFHSPASAAVTGSQDITVTHYNVKGKDPLYPSSDWNYQYDGSLRFKENAGDREYTGAFDYSYTDDANAPRRFAIQRMTFGLKQEGMEFQLGDSFANFSEYSLANALKGVQAVFGEPGYRRLTLAAGVDTPSWGSLAGDGGADNDAGRRYVWGARLENPFENGRGAINFNYAGARDDAAFTAAGTPVVSTNVVSVDGRYRLTDNLEANAELAQSFGEADTRSSDGGRGGTAGRIGFDLTLPHYTLHTMYRGMSDHFRAVGGYTGQERSRLDIDGKWSLTKAVIEHHFRTDTLIASAGNIREINYGASATLQLPWEMSWDLGADFLKRSSPDGTGTMTGTYTTALSRSFRHYRARLGFSRQAIDEKDTSAPSRDIDSLDLGLSGEFPVKGVALSWNLGEQLRHTRYRSGGRSDMAMLTNAGIKAHFPSSLLVEARASLGTNRYAGGQGDSDISELYLGVSRQIRNGVSFSVSCERKKYAYAQSINNVTENIVKASVHYVF